MMKSSWLTYQSSVILEVIAGIQVLGKVLGKHNQGNDVFGDNPVWLRARRETNTAIFDPGDSMNHENSI